jgi:3-hydroxybutyryl-CoA dehydratase
MRKTYHVTQAMIDRYGVINGDRDIIHYDADYARQRGFPAPLAHGLMVQGYANDMAMDVYGADWCTRGSIKVKFVKPVYPDEDITIEINESGEITATAPHGVAMVGTATLRAG